MQRILGTIALLAGIGCVGAGAVYGQQATAANNKPLLPAIDLAVTYTPEHGQHAVSTNGLWLQGGGVDAAVLLSHGLGYKLAANGEYASNLAPGMGFNRLMYLAGPVYDVKANQLLNSEKRNLDHLHIFCEGLIGGAHAFDSSLPANTGTTSRGDSFGLQAGAGLNMNLNQRFGLRLVQVDYVRTGFRNNGANVQNDMRLAFGATLHLR